MSVIHLNSNLSQLFTIHQIESGVSNTLAGHVDTFTDSYIPPRVVAQARSPLEEAKLTAKRAEKKYNDKTIPPNQRYGDAKKLYIEAWKIATTGGDNSLASEYAIEAGLIAKLEAFLDGAYSKGENKLRLEQEAVHTLEFGVKGANTEAKLRGLEALLELYEDSVKIAQTYNEAIETSKILEKSITDPNKKYSQRDKSWTLMDKAGVFFFRGEKYNLADKAFTTLAGEIGDKNRKATYGAMAALCHLVMADLFVTSIDMHKAAGEYNKAAKKLKAAIKDMESPSIAGVDERSSSPTFLNNWIKNAWYDLHMSKLLPIMDKTVEDGDLRIMLAIVYMKEGDASAAADDLQRAAVCYQEAKNILTGIKDEINLGSDIEKYIRNIGNKKDIYEIIVKTLEGDNPKNFNKLVDILAGMVDMTSGDVAKMLATGREENFKKLGLNLSQNTRNQIIKIAKSYT